jgi:RimJ/RimL family protein N-acetyltransferase
VAGPADEDALYAVATEPGNRPQWLQRGKAVDHGGFLRTLTDGALCAFVAESLNSAKPLAILLAYGADFQAQRASIAIAGTQSAQMSGQLVEALGLFVNYLFETHPFEKLYAEVVDFNLNRFASGQGRWFEIEGQLRNHEFVCGGYRDVFILSISRSRFSDLKTVYADYVLPKSV